MRRSLGRATGFLLGALVFSASPSRGDEKEKAASAPAPPRGDAVAIEHFEKEVRPILVNRCQECHGGTKQKGGLRLDSRGALISGGNSGPAIVPGKPGESILVDAINHGELFQMPPKSKLPAREIEVLTTWVQNGAHWGYEATAPQAGAKVATPDLNSDKPSEMVKQRAGFWSFQPVRDVEPPPVQGEASTWARNGIDQFILDGLQRQKLQPAAEASRSALIRRLSFDLTGVPPTPSEIDRFLADPSPDAYEKVVERLLASPRYGEAWGRHWLDLARYADTAGHEFDYETLSAFRYRDYVIRALNADLPYSSFITEQLAGDLLEKPRRHPTAGTNESILGTGFFWLGEGSHSPVDVREEEMRRVDNQIDVFSKTFLGLTVGCARCHDHKFDPITARDYYALAGYLRSSRFQQAFLDGPDRIAPLAQKLNHQKESVRDQLLQALPLLPEKQRTELAAILSTDEGGADWGQAPPQSADAGANPNPASATGPIVFETFDAPSFDTWRITGDAFGAGPTREGAFLLEAIPRTPTTADWRIRPVARGLAHSGLLGNDFEGVLRSRAFTIERRYIHMLASGRHGRINIVVDRFDKNRDPIYGGLTISVNAEDPHELKWITRDVSMWSGHSAYFELADGSSADYSGGQTRRNPGDGFLAVDEIVFSDQATPPAAPAKSGRTPVPLGPVLSALEQARSPLLAGINAALSDYQTAGAGIPEPTYGLAIADGSPEDERVLIRGNHKNPGGPVPRRLLEVLGGREAPRPESGSGRLELARQLTDPKNPLVARVMVNRLWQHHFGVGLVKSADDFGAMGQKPSHPELLDWLARQFVARGWSLKAIHRLMVTSSTYRMKSVLNPEAERIDPTNMYLHRMNVKRLEGEVIRDAIVFLSTGLNESMYGPSVKVHLTSFMEGRGRPSGSGPLDGDRRRSIYLGVRRNFLNPMLLAFDTPSPFSTMGRRNVSNVPAQALTLLNDPLVLTQARLWAERIAREPASGSAERVDRLYRGAFGRPPTPAEAEASLAFLAHRERAQSENPGAGDASNSNPNDRTLAAWADLCHVLINVKEFIYVE